MPAQPKPMQRRFKLNNQTLGDPAPGKDVATARQVLSTRFPEVATATIEGPHVISGVQVYTFKTSVGVKG